MQLDTFLSTASLSSAGALQYFFSIVSLLVTSLYASSRHFLTLSLPFEEQAICNSRSSGRGLCLSACPHAARQRVGMNVCSFFRRLLTVSRSRPLIEQHFPCSKFASLLTGSPSMPSEETSRPLLDRDRFTKTLTVPSIEIEKKKLHDVLFLFKPFLLKQISCPGVIGDSEKEAVKHILLDPSKVKSVKDLGEDVCRKLTAFGIPDVLQFREVHLKYENMKTEEVLKQILPDELPMSSWSTIGHIAHLNLKDHHLPFKYIIGQVLLDKNRPHIKLVVNKTSTIENKFRFFPMEVLAQESDDVTTLVQTKIGSCRFEFDFAGVYWNPRLDTEHQRIIDQLRPGMDVVYDVFAGVGPFSIPMARKKCKALANDLNPESYKWLKHNAALNKVTEYHLCFNMDGREFIRGIVRDDIVSEWKAFNSGEECKVKKFHIVMNLPALAIEFLDAFVGWFDDRQEEIDQLQTFELPTIHCYTFVKGVPEEECEQVVLCSAEASLQTKIKDVKEVKLVRKVSPNKIMFRISFGLPLDACLTQKRAKKLKSDPE